MGPPSFVVSMKSVWSSRRDIPSYRRIYLLSRLHYDNSYLHSLSGGVNNGASGQVAVSTQWFNRRAGGRVCLNSGASYYLDWNRCSLSDPTLQVR